MIKTPSETLSVIVNNIVVGNISIENGERIFSYSIDNPSSNKENYISLTMPIRIKDYCHNQLHPIFEMHLPEGYLLSIIKKHYSKIAKTDDFGLLQIMSDKIKGRLQYLAQSHPQNTQLTLDDLLHAENNELFDELVSKFALTSSLSGVQPKVLAAVQDKATLELNDYIIKSWGNDYPQLALNEYYCMQIVKNANIPVPDFYLSDDKTLFIMKRFDIKNVNSNNSDVNKNDKYIGFEDMCVLQAKQSDDKYEGSYEQIAKTIKIFVSSPYKKQALIQFFKMTIINFLIKNGDAHLKNFGLVYEDINNIKIAPAYDIVCTTVYIKSDIPALYLLGSKKWWHKKFLLRFGQESCNLSQKECLFYYNECLNAIKIISQEVNQALEFESDQEITHILSQLSDIFSLATQDCD